MNPVSEELGKREYQPPTRTWWERITFWTMWAWMNRWTIGTALVAAFALWFLLAITPDTPNL